MMFLSRRGYSSPTPDPGGGGGGCSQLDVPHFQCRKIFSKHSGSATIISRGCCVIKCTCHGSYLVHHYFQIVYTPQQHVCHPISSHTRPPTAPLYISPLSHQKVYYHQPNVHQNQYILMKGRIILLQPEVTFSKSYHGHTMKHILLMIFLPIVPLQSNTISSFIIH